MQLNTIRFKFTLNYQTISGSTGLRIESKNWDFKRARAKPSFKHASQYNTALSAIDEEIKSVLVDLQLKNNLSKEEFYLAYRSDKEKLSLGMSIFTFTNYYMIPNKRKEGKSEETIKSYKNSLARLRQYCFFRKMDEHSLTLERIMDYSFYLDYLGYLNLECGFMLNYQGSLIKHLKTTINHAKDLGIHSKNLSKKYKKPSETIEPLILEKSELAALETCEGLSSIESAARDWFLISCKTGLRISDFLDLNKANINLERNIISLRTDKNSNKIIEIPISNSIHKVLERNGGGLPQKMLDQKFNLNIKKVCQKAKINSKVIIERKIKGKIQSKEVFKYLKISAHCGRRTFATHAFLDGLLDLPELMLITGHSDLKTLMLYIKVDNKKAAIKMQANMDKLNW